MSFSDIFQKPVPVKSKGRVNHTFSDADRDKARARRMQRMSFNETVRKKKAELELLELELQKREKILQIKQVGKPLIPDEDEDYSDDEDEDFEDDEEENSPLDNKIASLLEKAFTPAPVEKSPVEIELTPEQIVAQIPKDKREQLKKMSPEKIHELARLYYPELKPPTIDAIIPLL